MQSSCKPEDVLAAQNYNAIRNWLYLDMAVYGVYNNLVWAYLEEHNATPEFAPGDAEALKNGHPDFIGFNYYNTSTVEASDGTEQSDPGADQQTARGEAGFYRGSAILICLPQSLAGRLTPWASVQPFVRCILDIAYL